MAIEELEATPAMAARKDIGPRKGEFLGHPYGLPVIAGTEAFERFSYYGMQTLLVLYMIKYLLLPEHIGNVAGFGWFSGVLSAIYGAAPTTQALSSHVFGTYAALVYLTPILGGILADSWLGKTRTVTLGALLMTAGHFLMAFEVSFLLALLLLVLGVGCLKGNLASQVGALYGPGDNRTADAFQIYYLGISAGAALSPVICGTLGEKVGWHWGFGAAGVGMVIGLIVYLAGQRHLPPESVRQRKADGTPRSVMTARDWQILALLIAMIPVLAVGALGNQQFFNAYIVWADRSYDFTIFGFRMPTSYLVMFDAVTGFATLAGSVFFWRWYGARRRKPDEITKMVIGCLISSLAFILVAIVASHAAATGTKVPLWIALVVNTLNNLGFANFFPVSLALYSRSAPRAIGGTMIGIYYLFLFGSNLLVGLVGGWLDIMPPAQFWGLHVAAVLAAGAICLVVKLAFGKLLSPTVT